MGFGNSKKDRFLKNRPQSGIETSDIAERCKFNFSYFDATQDCDQSFEDWGGSGHNSTSLPTLMEKIKEFTKLPLSYWKGQKLNGLPILAYYGDFPKKSDFKHPSHVPHDAYWVRFRLASKVRLIGFVIPGELNGKEVGALLTIDVGLFLKVSDYAE